MPTLNYRNGNIFDAPAGSLLLHACNAHGAWGAGIALQFAHRFPVAQRAYARDCAAHSADALAGTTRLYPAPRHTIACLITSRGYGKRRDAPDLILQFTRSALAHLLQQLRQTTAIHSPRINAGLFGVPWPSTAELLTQALDACPTAHTWTVWTL